MSISNRSGRIEKLYKVLKKHFTAAPIASERSVLDLLLYGSCLEDAPYDAADEAFAKLQQSFTDWNEVRVTTVVELAETVSNLPNPQQAALRIKKTLHSMFEARYSFDLEEMRKANLGKSTAEIEGWQGTTPFTVGFVVQNALGGHSIPVSNSALEFFQLAGIITEAEAEKRTVPGLERTIAKAKGPEFASLLHQFIVQMKSSPKSATVQTILTDLGIDPKLVSQTNQKSSPAKSAEAPPKKTAKVAKSTPAKTTAKASPTKATEKTTPKKAKAAPKKNSKKPAKKTVTKKAAKPAKKSKTNTSIKRKKPR